MERLHKVSQFTPWGEVVVLVSVHGLLGARFSDQGLPEAWAHAAPGLKEPVLQAAQQWLSRYAAGQRPSAAFQGPFDERAASDFQRRVWRALDDIAWGHTMTYGQLAEHLGSSPRAVGRAVGSNPCLLFRPCHRVMGAHGALTGYAAGVVRKKNLLAFEAQV